MGKEGYAKRLFHGRDLVDECFASFCFQVNASEQNRATVIDCGLWEDFTHVPPWGKELLGLLCQLFKTWAEATTLPCKVVLRRGKSHGQEEILLLLYTSIQSPTSKMFLGEVVKLAQADISCCGVVLLVWGEGAFQQFEQVLWGKACIQDFFCGHTLVVSTDVSYPLCPQLFFSPLFENCTKAFISHIVLKPLIVFDPFCANGWALAWLSSLLEGYRPTFYGRERNPYAFFDACENVPYAHLMRTDLDAAWREIERPVSLLFLHVPQDKLFGEGLDEVMARLFDFILQDRPPYIFYFSCSPKEPRLLMDKLFCEGWAPVVQADFVFSGKGRVGEGFGERTQTLHLLKRG